MEAVSNLFYRKLPWLMLITLLLVSTILGVNVTPLTSVHWDSPIYLYQGKRMAETPLLESYASKAFEVAEQVDGNWPSGEGYSEAYWRYSRLGHIVLVGSVVGLFGSTEKTIWILHWLFHFIMAIAIFFAVVTVMELVVLFRVPFPRIVVLWSGIVSAGVFVLSSIYDYLGRSLVSEVPSTFLIIAACYFLVLAMRRGSLLIAFVSGVLAFFIYWVRIEGIWVYVTFGVILALSFWDLHKKRYLYCLLVAGATALVCYFAYSWRFYPLTDPRLFLTFAKHQKEVAGGVSPLFSLGAAGGMLWIGALISVIYTRHIRLARMSILWLVLILAPTLPYLLSGSPVQARMFSTLLLPLFLLSILGWACLWERTTKNGLIGIAVFGTLSAALIVVAFTPSYEWLRRQPGLWRVQYLRQAITPPLYEQKSYPYQELRRISEALYTYKGPGILVTYGDIAQEHLNLVRFFGPSYPQKASLSTESDPTNLISCNQRKLRQDLEPVAFCKGITKKQLTELINQGIKIFALAPEPSPLSHINLPLGYAVSEILITNHFYLGLFDSHEGHMEVNTGAP